MKTSGEIHDPAALQTGENVFGNHCEGGWLDPRAGLDALGK